MNFPTATNLGMFLITGPIVLCFCLFFIIKYLQFLYARYILHVEPRPNSTTFMKLPEGHMMIPFILATLLIGSVHFWGSSSSMANGRAFKNLRPEGIKVIEVQKLKSEGELEGARIERIEDPQIIAEAFNSVQGASSYPRNHEHFLDGYRLHFVNRDPEARKDCYLSVYRKTKQYRTEDRIVDVDIVVPHVGSVSGGAVNDAGEFSCPSFWGWVKKRVDPLFQE
jgi:hypothetical protein